MHVFEQLGRRFFFLSQTKSFCFTHIQYIAFFSSLSGRAEMDAALSYQSHVPLASKTPQSCQARTCFSGEDYKC